MKNVRVRVPELQLGPPHPRFKREHVRVVDIGTAEQLVAEHGAEILDDSEPPKSKAAKGKTTKADD